MSRGNILKNMGVLRARPREFLEKKNRQLGGGGGGQDPHDPPPVHTPVQCCNVA